MNEDELKQAAMVVDFVSKEQGTEPVTITPDAPIKDVHGATQLGSPRQSTTEDYRKVNKGGSFDYEIEAYEV